MVHLFELFLCQLLSGTAVSFNEYIYIYFTKNKPNGIGHIKLQLKF